MKISARNALKGKIVEVKEARRLRTCASISAVRSSPRRSPMSRWTAPGQTAYAVIKASDVMVGVD